MTSSHRPHPESVREPGMLLFAPGTAPDAAAVGDGALLGALLEAEVGWLGAQADLGLVPQETAAEVVAALGEPADYPLGDIAADAASGGNPVIPFLAHARVRVSGLPAAGALYMGLTSQDVIDTAMMLLLARMAALVWVSVDDCCGDIACHDW